MVYGIDEVGRGAWAGPLIVAGVSCQWQKKFEFDDIKKIWRLNADQSIVVTDSKKLNRKSRELSAKWLMCNASYRIGMDSAKNINKFGIRKVWDRLVEDLVKDEDSEVVIDGEWKPGGLENVRNLVRGDMLVWEIAAASIIAKVYRDNLMANLAKKYQGYGWERNVGYGTREHREAIRQLGLNDQHRELWVRKVLGSC